MGFRVGDHCFMSRAGAEDYFYSQQPIIPIQSNVASYLQFSKSNDKWYQVIFVNNASVSTVEAPSISFAECSPASDFGLGAAVGFSMLLVFAIAWGYRQIGGFFNNDN